MNQNNAATKKVINQEVAVTSVYFRPGRHLKGFPKRMEYEGREYTFLESGLRYLVRQGQKLIEIFDVTDGSQDYRLSFDSSAYRWTLIGVRENQHVIA